MDPISTKPTVVINLSDLGNKNFSNVTEISLPIINKNHFFIKTKEAKKTAIRLQEEKENIISFLDLPPSFQVELKDEFSDEMCVVCCVALKIMQLSFEISSQGSAELDNLLKHLHFLAHKIYDIYMEYYSQSNTKSTEKFISLKNCLHILLIDIENIIPNINEHNRQYLQRIYNLIHDLNENIQIDNKPIFFQANLSRFENNGYHNEITPLKALANLQKKINIIFRFYSDIHKSFLENNATFQSYEKFKNSWENIDNLFKKIKIYFSTKRKKGITFNTCHQIMDNLWHRLEPFKNFALLCMNNFDLQIYKNLPTAPILNYEKYSIIKSETKLAINPDIVSNILLFDSVMRFVRICTMDIRHEITKIGTSYCQENNLILSKNKMNKLFSYLNKFVKSLNDINISFDNNSAMTPMGKINGNYVFSQINSILNILNANWKRYSKDSRVFHIGNIYMNLFWLRHCIGDTLVLFLTKLTNNLLLQKNKISQTKNKSHLEREKRLLEHSLNNVALIKELLIDYYYPIEEMINNFEEMLLIKKIEFMNPDQPKIEEKKEELIEMVPTINDITSQEEDQSIKEVIQDVEEKIEEIDLETPVINKKRTKNKNTTESQENFDSKLSTLSNSLNEKNENYKRVSNVKFMELVDEVIEHGFLFLKQTGSHVNFKNPEHPELGIITVPRHQVVSPGVVKQVRSKLKNKR